MPGGLKWPSDRTDAIPRQGEKRAVTDETNTAQIQVTQRQVLTAGFASVVAWSFDLFDLFILLFVASTIGPLFFPSDSETLSLAATYASFAVTLLMRPIGSAIFGNYADKHGRKRAMVIAVTGVGVATALMGTLPTVTTVGLLAPILFLTLRIVQGIFVGGVVASTHTIGTETVPEKWRGLMSGLIGGGGAGLGALFASLVFFIVSSIFPGDAFSVWGWRFMFFSGIIGAILSLFIFRAVQESPLWARRERRDEVVSSPLKTLLSRDYLPAFLMSLVLVAGAGTHYYLTSGFLPTFLDVVNGVSKSESGRILVVSNLGVLIAAPLFGHLSEVFGRKKIFILLGVVNLIVIPFTYLQLASLTADSIVAIYVAAFVLAFFGNAAYAPVLVFLNERFPTDIRASGTGLGWNVGFAIGGIMPTFVTLASPTTADIPSRVVVFMVGAIVLYLIGAVINPETKGKLPW
jgi:MFS transporter, MHS family, proline/betaine transporter